MLFMIILLVGGVVAAVSGYSEKTRMDALNKDGTVVSGTIMSGESRRGRRSRSYKFEVAYQTKEGKTMTQEFSVTKDFFDSHTGGDAIINDQCQVRYLPSDPSTAIIEGGTSDMSWMMYAGAVAALIGGAGLTYKIKQKFGGGSEIPQMA